MGRKVLGEGEGEEEPGGCRHANKSMNQRRGVEPEGLAYAGQIFAS